MKKFSLILLSILTTFGSAMGADFFSTERVDQLFSFGVRLGVNTSNRTVSDEAMSGYNFQGWGTGFDLGVTVDLNIRDYISLQPGFFFQSRSNSYTFIRAIPVSQTEEVRTAQAGTFNSYAFVIPILANMHFNVTDNVRWNVAAGPYFAFNLGSRLNNKVNLGTNFIEGQAVQGHEFIGKPAGCDAGLKIGTGIEIFRHYSFNVDYMAGMRHAWKNKVVNYGGRTKGWVFTLGYSF